MSSTEPDSDDAGRIGNDSATHAVTVEGRERVVVTGPGDFPRATLTCTVECASGERATGEWAGVPVAALADAAAFPGATTHLRVAAADFAADVPIRPALDGLVAFERRGDREEGKGENGKGEETGLPRFVADGVPGERLVKRVRRITAVALAPRERPRVG